MRTIEQIVYMIENGKHFCILPWVQLYVNGVASMARCCNTTLQVYGSFKTNSLEELWQGEAIRSFRLKMLDDEMDEHCMPCYKIEESGNPSIRMIYNNNFKEFADWVANTDDNGYAPDAKPVVWDIRFSNKCNLRCRTCSSDYSTAWYKDAADILRNKALGSVPELDLLYKLHDDGLKITKKLLLDLEEYFPFVVQIYCAGGEPLLIKENLSILEKMSSIGKYDYNLIYNTNLTQLHKSSEYLSYWKRHKRLMVLVSMDGSHEKGEYIRKGMRWDTVVNNLEILKHECPHANIIINFTVSVFNILHLPDFHKEMVEKGYLKADQIQLNFLHSPEIYNSKILPKELKEQAVRNIYEHIAWLKQQPTFSRIENSYQTDQCNIFDQWYACINYINSEDWTSLIPQFIEATNELDELRDEKLLDVFPELEPMVNYCPNQQS